MLRPIRRVRSQGPRCVKQTSEKIEVKVPYQRSPYAVKFEDRLQKRLQDKRDAPAEMRGNLPRKSMSSKNEDNILFTF